jgi:peptide/nickel transport system substrate-binding protein
MNSKIAFLLGAVVVVFAMACTKEVVKEVPVDRVVTREVIKEVPVEKIVEVEKTVTKIIEVEKPVTVIKEVVRRVEVPGETVVLEKEVIKTVQVPGETVVVEKEVIKTVEKEVIKTVEVPGETVVVEKEVVVVRTVKVEATLSPSLQREADRYGGDLRVVSSGGFGTLDSDFSGAYTSAACCMHLHESYFKYDEDFISRPELVDTWQISPDGKTYTFTFLKHDFHNTEHFESRPVVADDIIESTIRWTKKHSGGKALKQFGFGDVDADPVAGTDIVRLDDYTVRFTLANSFNPLIAHMGAVRGAMQIWPQEIAALSPNEDVGEKNIVGSGPYQLAQWDPGFRVIHERNENYVPRNEPHSNFAGAQIPYMDRIIILEVPDNETKIAGLRTAEWDIIDTAPADFLNVLLDDPNINVNYNVPGSMSNVLFNHRSSVMSNLKIRQAIQAAINAEDMMASFGPKGTWSLCAAMFHCETPLARTIDDGLYNQGNMARAKELLAESGYAGEEVIMLNPTDLPILTPMGFVLKPLLDELGLNVKAPTIDWSSEIGILFGGEDFIDKWDIATMGFGFYGLHDPITDGPYDPNGGFSWYGNEKLGELRIRWANTLDPEERDQIVDEMQLEKYRDVPFVILGMYHALHPYRTYVKNFGPMRAMPHQTNVWIDR